MTVLEFINKWEPAEPNKYYEFQDDLRSVLDTLTGQYHTTALMILTNIEGAELVLDTVDDFGRMSFGPEGKSIEVGISVTYPLATGQKEADWLLLLKCITSHALNGMK